MYILFNPQTKEFDDSIILPNLKAPEFKKPDDGWEWRELDKEFRKVIHEKRQKESEEKPEFKLKALLKKDDGEKVTVGELKAVLQYMNVDITRLS